jgi:hypothetical protein
MSTKLMKAVNMSDESLQLALRYAQHKWGGELRLAGGDHVFRKRVARTADVMGIKLADLGLSNASAKDSAALPPEGKARSR